MGGYHNLERHTYQYRIQKASWIRPRPSYQPRPEILDHKHQYNSTTYAAEKGKEQVQAENPGNLSWRVVTQLVRTEAVPEDGCRTRHAKDHEQCTKRVNYHKILLGLSIWNWLPSFSLMVIEWSSSSPVTKDSFCKQCPSLLAGSDEYWSFVMDTRRNFLCLTPSLSRAGP